MPTKPSGSRPLLKWAGGKRQLLPDLLKRVPKRIDGYCEPFFGGGALFFALQGRIGGQVLLNDVNAELMNFYRCVRDCPGQLLAEAERHVDTPEHYYRIRSWDREPWFAGEEPVVRAGRFWYLNRTGFNGLYRVNGKGYCNVPYGRRRAQRWHDPQRLEVCARALQGAVLLSMDFEVLLERLPRGAFVYLDPPYVPLKASSFTGYTPGGFSLDDHRRLADFCRRLDASGRPFLLSNSGSDLVREIYAGFPVVPVQARRAINRDGAGRGRVAEVLIGNCLG